jgi:uridine monophosphate synthetase
MMASEVWGERWSNSTSEIARRYMEVACRKKSLVCLAADRRTMAGLFELIDLVGPHIAALKTHVDLVDDWTPEGWSEFCSRAHKADLLIFEDRKFADIGKISRNQMAGIYDIRTWSDLVTAHLISGPDIVDGLQAGWKDVGRDGGVLLLAQMSSRGNLLNPNYTDEVVTKGGAHSGVFGFIGNGSRPEELAELRSKVGKSKMIWTPGVNLAVGDGEMGQRYGDPREAILAGSDCIIVGSGIHRSENPAAAAQSYASASWNALVERGS